MLQLTTELLDRVGIHGIVALEMSLITSNLLHGISNSPQVTIFRRFKLMEMSSRKEENTKKLMPRP